MTCSSAWKKCSHFFQTAETAISIETAVSAVNCGFYALRMNSVVVVADIMS